MTKTAGVGASPGAAAQFRPLVSRLRISAMRPADAAGDLPVLHGTGFHGDLAPDESFGAVFYRFTARPPLNPVVVGHMKLGPACPGLFSSENNGALTELTRRHNCGGSKKESYMPQYWASIARLPIGRGRRCRTLRG